jgi:exosortase E/protease (VPEID-CTERM system)
MRWACLLALLLAEVLALTLRFDTGSLAGERGWWADLLGHSPQVFQLSSVIALATLVFGWPRLRGELERALGAPHVDRAWWLALLGHLVALAVFALLTTLVLEGGIGSSPSPGAWAVTWALTGALTLALWGAATVPVGLWLPLARCALLPLVAGVVVGSAAWGAGLCAERLWQPLGRWTLWVVQHLLGLVSSDVVYQPGDFVVGTRSFFVQIAPGCSGYEGMGLTAVFLGFYLWFYRADLRFPQAFCLLPVGVALIWLVNAVRIAALVAIGSWGAVDVALGGFHSQAGWLGFISVGLGLVAVTRRLRVFSAAPAAAPGSNPAAPYLVPLLALLAATMITGAFSSGFDWLYPVRVLAVGSVLWSFRRAYAGWHWGWSWPAVALGVVVFGLWLTLEPGRAGPAGSSELAAGLAGWPRGWAVAWLLFRVFGSVVTVPLAEELAFRGYLNRRLIAADFENVPIGKFTWLSFVVSSAAFGALHSRWLAGMLAGMLYALALTRRGRLSDAVLAHAMTNALLAAYVLTTGAWSLWP